MRRLCHPERAVGHGGVVAGLVRAVSELLTLLPVRQRVGQAVPPAGHGGVHAVHQRPAAGQVRERGPVSQRRGELSVGVQLRAAVLGRVGGRDVRERRDAGSHTVSFHYVSAPAVLPR